jgi:hypothetical protein
MSPIPASSNVAEESERLTQIVYNVMVMAVV